MRNTLPILPLLSSQYQLETEDGKMEKGLEDVVDSTQGPCPCRVHEDMSRRQWHARIQGTWCIQAIDRVSGFSHACGAPLQTIKF